MPKTIKNIKQSPGAIERLSIAVLVDDKLVIKEEKGVIVEKKWISRTEEELEKYKALVENAIGFYAERGDSISIENIPFEKEFFEDIKEEKKEIPSSFFWILGLAVFCFSFLVLVQC